MPFLNSNYVSSCHLTNERQSAAIRLAKCRPDNISVFLCIIKKLCPWALQKDFERTSLYILNRCFLIVEVCRSKPIICQGSNSNTLCPKFSRFQDSEIIKVMSD